MRMSDQSYCSSCYIHACWQHPFFFCFFSISLPVKIHTGVFPPPPPVTGVLSDRICLLEGLCGKALSVQVRIAARTSYYHSPKAILSSVGVCTCITFLLSITPPPSSNWCHVVKKSIRARKVAHQMFRTTLVGRVYSRFISFFYLPNRCIEFYILIIAVANCVSYDEVGFFFFFLIEKIIVIYSSTDFLSKLPHVYIYIDILYMI